MGGTDEREWASNYNNPSHWPACCSLLHPVVPRRARVLSMMAQANRGREPSISWFHATIHEFEREARERQIQLASEQAEEAAKYKAEKEILGDDIPLSVASTLADNSPELAVVFLHLIWRTMNTIAECLNRSLE